MSLRALSVLQWLGLLVGAGVWTGQHVVGFGITQAECGAAAARFGIGNDVWQLTLLACAGLFVVLAEAASVLVFMATKGANFGDGPKGDGRWNGALPQTRLHFFAISAMLANLLFLVVILLDGLGSVFHVLCRQS